jgi:hypothetical protein
VYNTPVGDLPSPVPDVPDAPLPASEVIISIDYAPKDPIADGRSLVMVLATVTTRGGRPIQWANVWFFMEGYSYRDGTVFGGDEAQEIGVKYEVVPSGGYVTGTKSLSNLLDVVTNDQGQATAYYRVPEWQYYMGNKPILIGA